MPLSASKCSNIVAYNPLSDCRQCVRARMVPADICLYAGYIKTFEIYVDIFAICTES